MNNNTSRKDKEKLSLKKMTILIALMTCCLLAGMSECLNSEVSNKLLNRKSRAANGDNELSSKLTWECPLKYPLGYLSESDRWYRFLNGLYCKFSEYEIQVAKKRYNVADIEEWGNPGADDSTDPLKGVTYAKESHNGVQGIEIDQYNFQRFLDKIEEYNIEEHDTFINESLTDLQLRELNHVLNITIKQGIHITCKEPYMFIKGDYIIVSQIHLRILAGVIDDSCRGLLFTNRLKFLNIFSLNTIFMDADMPTIGMLEPMTIISPKWQIIGWRKIKLHGRDGDLQTSRRDSRYYFHGADGKPGKHGGPGGSFFGIGEEFINGASLLIFVNGGNGSPGEDGENGRNGNNGTTPTVPSSSTSCRADLCKNNERINFFKCQNLGCRYVPSTAYNIPTLEHCDYKLFGDDGTAGGNGGNGGRGGKGGNPGIIELFELNNYSGISKINHLGQDGIDGNGGVGGFGGKRGNDIVVRCKAYFLSSDDWTLTNTLYSYEKAASGLNGLPGANPKYMEPPLAATGISKLDKAKIINQYKSYLRENLNDRFKSYFLSKFLKKLEDNDSVKSVYDTLGLIDELQSLEETFHKLNEDVDFFPFYQSLLNRISEYGQHPSEVANTNLIKKVLGYLYTATLGRLHNLEDNLESNLIIDISAYLELVKNDIEKLKDLQNANIKEEIINKYKQEYKQKIDEKIKEAIDIIAKDITPEIDNIDAQTNEQVELLIIEVTHLQQQSRVEHEQLSKKKQELKNALILQDLISSLKIFGSVISFLGPIGAAAGSVIGIGGTVAETFIFNTPGHLNSTVSLTQTVADLGSLKDKIKTIRDQKVKSLKTSLESISQEANKHPDTFADISVKLSDYRSRLDKISGNRINSYHLQEVQNLEIELKATLQTKGSEILNSQEGTADPKTKNEFAAIQRMQQAVQLSSSVLDAYNKHHFNQAKLDTINNIIRQNENKFHKLKEFEDKIYSTIVPMLQNMQNDIDNIVNSLEKKSEVALDVAKWKVKSTLGDMMIQMRQLTQEFKVQDNLVRCIEKMREAIVTLINIHDHIHNFQKDQTIANFIADINSITVMDTHIIDNPILERDLRRAINELEITLRSSIVAQRHKVAIDAFKQFVFPFADTYFKELMLPNHLKLEGNEIVTLENLVYKAVTDIDHLKSKLEWYRQTIRNQDECIGSGKFNSDHISSKPFFIWKNDEHKSMISKLLSGEAVTVKADVTDSKFDAVKFNIINFGFKSKDKIRELEINNMLKGFMINATHLGNSYYRYNNNIYLMTTPSRDIWYYFEKDYNGEPLHRSSSYDKLKNGDFVLSPYAGWRIKLIEVTNHITFRNLEIYKDEIDLELGGRGYYVNQAIWDCTNLEVEKYYKAIDT